MAEGYVKTSANNVNDLLNQIVGQAVAHGWTQHHLGEQGGDQPLSPQLGRRGHISKDGVVINLASYPGSGTQNGGAATSGGMVRPQDRHEGYNWGFGNNNSGWVNPDALAICASSGFLEGEHWWYRQPGADQLTNDTHYLRVIRAKDAIGNVWMFFHENPAALSVVCEVRPGHFYWLTGGNIQTDYPLEVAQFYGASLAPHQLGNGYPSTLGGVQVRAVHPNAAPTRQHGWGGYVPSPDIGYGPGIYSPAVGAEVPAYPTQIRSSSTPNDDLVPEPTRGYDPLTGRFWPHPVRAYMNKVGGGRSYIGVIPHIHFCTTSHFVGEEVVSIGGDEYMIFPANWRSSPYGWDVTTTSYDVWGPWYRNNTRGTGIAIRRPAP